MSKRFAYVLFRKHRWHADVEDILILTGHIQSIKMLKSIQESIFALSPISVSAIVVLLTIIYYYFKNRNTPPGPVGIPYLGMWPFLAHYTAHLKLDEMKKKYGDVFSLTVTGQLYINLASVKALREAHITKSDCFTGRPTVYTMLENAFDGGLPFINGEAWKVMRKFFSQSFKEFGMTALKNASAGQVYDHLNSAVEKLRASRGTPVNIVELFGEKCMNIIHGMVLNSDAITKEEFMEFNSNYEKMLGSMTSLDMLITGFFAKRIIVPFRHSYKKSLVDLEKLLYKIIDRRESTLDPSNVRDIIDYFFKERNERRKKGDPTAEYFTKKCLMATLLQILGDGVMGVAAFVATFVHLIAKHPEEQEKVYKEIIDAVSLNRQPSLEDKSNLPYTNAFMYEVLRKSDFFPMFPSLVCTKETTIRGYRIPKGAITLMNIYSAHNDAECYENPDEFRPSRFISTPDKPRADLPITFGVGKRACAGEGYVMTQVFLFLATIVKNFEISLPKDCTSFAELMELKVTVKERSHQQQSANAPNKE